MGGRHKAERVSAPEPQRYGPDQHAIRTARLDPDARAILRILSQAGFESYLVGGAVRDLWLGGEPKDYDIGTVASTDEIRKLFRWSRTIGRRFPIVHVYRKPRKVFEVSTFRQSGGEMYGTVNRGTPGEDARRRDLTVNALMFDLDKEEVIDWVGGVEDLQDRRIRIIGDPVERLTEDPVRIIRAYRLSHRINFNIEGSILEAEKSCFHLLSEVSAGRLKLEKEKDFLGELSSGIIKSYRDAPFGAAVDKKLIAILHQASEDRFDLYDSLAVQIRRHPEWDDEKGLLRVALLGTLLDIPCFAPQAGSMDGGMQVLDEAIEPLLLALEVPRWKRPLVVQGIYGQQLVDQQIRGGFGAKLRRKTWFSVALQIARLRYASYGGREEELRIGNRELNSDGPAATSTTPPRKRRPPRRRRRRVEP